MTAATFDGSASDTTGSTSVPLTFGTVQANGWALLGVELGNTTSTVTTPTGWTLLVPITTMGSRRFTIFGRSIDATQTGTVVTVTTSAGVSTRATLVWGHGSKALANWITGAVYTRAGTGTTTNTAPSITTTAADTLLVAFSFEATSATEATMPTVGSPWTMNTYGAQGTGGLPSGIETIGVATLAQAAVGASPTAVFTYPNSQASNGAAVMFAIPAVVTAPATATASRIVGGAKQQVAVWKVSGGTKTALSHVWTVGRGVQTTSALVAKPGFVVGHMGARWDEVEGSMEGITRSLMYGADALMLSIARTSDGKYFLLNDTKYLDRMALGNDTSTTLDSSTMTWAQVQAYDQGSYWTKRNSPTPRRPFMLLTDFLASYPTAGPILLDPKTVSPTFYGEVLDIMDANGGPARFVGKYYCTGTAWADACHTRNSAYKTWGYFYASEIAAGTVNLDTLAPKWDWLGLDYGGAQAQWTQVLAKGKPVIGHIAKTRANYDTAIAKGASGVMCEGVAEARNLA